MIWPYYLIVIGDRICAVRAGAFTGWKNYSYEYRAQTDDSVIDRWTRSLIENP